MVEWSPEISISLCVCVSFVILFTVFRTIHFRDFAWFWSVVIFVFLFFWSSFKGDEVGFGCGCLSLCCFSWHHLPWSSDCIHPIPMVTFEPGCLWTQPWKWMILVVNDSNLSGYVWTWLWMIPTSVVMYEPNMKIWKPSFRLYAGGEVEVEERSFFFVYPNPPHCYFSFLNRREARLWHPAYWASCLLYDMFS